MQKQTSMFDTEMREIEIRGEINSATGKITYYEKVTQTIKVPVNKLGELDIPISQSVPIPNNKSYTPLPKTLKTKKKRPLNI